MEGAAQERHAFTCMHAANRSLMGRQAISLHVSTPLPPDSGTTLAPRCRTLPSALGEWPHAIGCQAHGRLGGRLFLHMMTCIVLGKPVVWVSAAGTTSALPAAPALLEPCASMRALCLKGATYFQVSAGCCPC